MAQAQTGLQSYGTPSCGAHTACCMGASYCWPCSTDGCALFPIGSLVLGNLILPCCMQSRLHCGA